MVVLELTKLILESDFKACKIGSLWKAKNDHQTSQGERGSPPADLEAQNSVLATENPLYFRG